MVLPCPYLECCLFRCDVFCSYHALLQIHFLFVVLRTITIYFSTPLISRLQAFTYVQLVSLSPHLMQIFYLVYLLSDCANCLLLSMLYLQNIFLRLNEHVFCFKIGSNYICNIYGAKCSKIVWYPIHDIICDSAPMFECTVKRNWLRKASYNDSKLITLLLPRSFPRLFTLLVTNATYITNSMCKFFYAIKLLSSEN